MRGVRWIVVMLFALVPLSTLWHRNDLGRWEENRSAMAAPDEFSYLLLADNLLHGGGGISTQGSIGRDTFYPPGYPLLLAAWGGLVGLTVFHAHVLNAWLLCLTTLLVYVLAGRLLRALGETERDFFRFSDSATAWIAAVIAALFATNWHVLEGGLYVFSEPAFMLVTLGWLALSLRWRRWQEHVGQTVVLALLAVGAWSIRGAGIVCVGAMIIEAAAGVVGLGRSAVASARGEHMRHASGVGTGRKRGTRRWHMRHGSDLSTGQNHGPQIGTQNDPRSGSVWIGIRSIVIVVVLAGVYQVCIAWASPEKSLASGGESDNSYTHQLMQGLTKRGAIHVGDPREWPALGGHVADLIFSHLDDYGLSFTPWFRESPDFHFLNIVGKAMGVLGLLGWMNRLLRKESATRLVEVYVLLYICLYLVWPFDMARFWAPVLPVMLAYAVDGVRQFWGVASRVRPQWAAAVLLTLLLALYGEELIVQLGHYERRLNYVSDALAGAAATVARLSPDPAETIVAVGGSSEHFLFAWYLPHGDEPRRVAPAQRAGVIGIRERTRPVGPALHDITGRTRPVGPALHNSRARGRYLPRSPEPHLAGKGGRRETVEELLKRSMEEVVADRRREMFVMSYYGDPNYPEIFAELKREDPALFEHREFRRVFQKEIIVTVWEYAPW